MGPGNAFLNFCFYLSMLGAVSASRPLDQMPDENVNQPGRNVNADSLTDHTSQSSSSRNSTNAEKDLDNLQTLSWLTNANSLADPCQVMALYANFRHIFIEHCGTRAIWDRTLYLTNDEGVPDNEQVGNLIIHEHLGDTFNTTLDLRCDLNKSDCFIRMRRIALRLLPPNHTWANSLKRMARTKSPLLWLQKLDNLYLKKKTVTSSHIKRQYLSFRYKTCYHMTDFLEEFTRRADLLRS